MMPAPNVSPRRSSRREFLGLLGRGAAAGAVLGAVPRLAAVTRKYRGVNTAPRALVLVQLEGGNDGLNTIVPFHDDNYHRLRPTLALAAADLILISDRIALNRAAGALEPFFKDGRLAVVPQAGYANQSPSHYRSAEIWHTASAADEVVYDGWAGRCFAHLQSQGRAVSGSHASTAAPRLFLTGSGRYAGEQASGLDPAGALARVAGCAAATAGTEIHFISVPGFDTHYGQRDAHAERLHAVSVALAAMQLRLAQRGVADRVLTMVFSEFGRTAAENHQGGTDHGGAGPVFLLGPQVAGGLQAPSGPVDFRRIVRSVATDWLGVPPAAVFACDPGAAGFLRLPLVS